MLNGYVLLFQYLQALMIFRVTTLLLLVFATIGQAAAQQVAPSASTALMPGDRLEIVVWRNAELTGTYTVLPDGSLLHPLYSRVRVAGVPLEDARESIAGFLAEFVEEPLFTLQPLYRVYVGGNVRTQGEYHLAGISVGQAITTAGGSTTPGSRYRVRLIRGGAEQVVDMNGIDDVAILQQRVQSGDQVLVEEKPTFSRRYLSPALQVIQTVTGLVATFVYFDAIFGS